MALALLTIAVFGATLALFTVALLGATLALRSAMYAVLPLETQARARACCRAFPGRSGVGRGADGITDIARSRQTWRRAIRAELTLQVSSIARLILYDQRPAGRSSEGKGASLHLLVSAGAIAAQEVVGERP